MNDGWVMWLIGPAFQPLGVQYTLNTTQILIFGKFVVTNREKGLAGSNARFHWEFLAWIPRRAA
jgi:hypothetical protein